MLHRYSCITTEAFKKSWKGIRNRVNYRISNTVISNGCWIILMGGIKKVNTMPN